MTAAPPTPARSMSVTSAPSWAPASAASYPPGPPPSTAMLCLRSNSKAMAPILSDQGSPFSPAALPRPAGRTTHGGCRTVRNAGAGASQSPRRRDAPRGGGRDGAERNHALCQPRRAPQGGARKTNAAARETNAGPRKTNIRVVSMASEDAAHPFDDPAADPFDIARIAAQQIAERTGVEHHDIALTLGSGWGKAADLIGETVATVPAADILG